MASRKFAVFSAVVAILVGYVIYDYWSDQSVTQKKREESALFLGKTDQIKSIEFDFPEGEANKSFQLTRTPEGWKSNRYSSEVADEESISQFLEGVSTEKSKATVVSGEGIDLGIFGLDRPLVKIRLTDNLGVVQEYAISAKKNFEGEAYLKKTGFQRVYLVSSSWIPRAEKKADDFRDRRLARVEAANIEQISIRKGREQFELIKEQQSWKFRKNSAWKPDQNKIRKFISMFSAGRLQNFSLKSAEDSMMEIKFALKSGKHWAGRIGIDKTKQHFLSVPEEGIHGVILGEDFNELIQVSEDGFRDRNQPFQFAKDDVKEIEMLLDGQNSMVIFKNAEVWESRDKTKPVDDSKVKAFLSKLNGMELMEFLDSQRDTHDSGKNSKIFLRAEAGKQIYSLSWGPFHRAKVSGLDKSQAVASSNLMKQRFTVDEDKMKDLGLAQIFIEKKSEQPQDK